MSESKVSLSGICSIVSKDLEEIEAKLLEKTASNFHIMDEAVQHVIESGGKRIRPILLLLSNRACNSKLNPQYLPDDVYELAVAVELIHAASLVHDDVVDEACLRRGRESVNKKWGNKIAVLIGDYLHTKVFSILATRKFNDAAMSIISEAIQAMCEGEIIHAFRKNDFEISKDDYLEIVDFKTGKLMTASCTIGAHTGTNDQILIDAITEYAKNLGIAFQIVDDLLDFVANEDVLGKQPFNDFREGKLTFPIIYTREQCNRYDRAKLERTFYAEFHTEENIAWISALLSKYNTKQSCLKVAQTYADKAKAALKILHDSPARNALLRMADYIVSRES
ncbi:TPA: polyprenyl synthetase family protein [Candidatus Poribacteria bacterium]|nr:polyprenyl synthetase family protein [Candidatus Poribacteria bacterium]